ncbi:hypothetical protein KIH74_32280 [Kineosporia sp. J2-2]|uniref:DNA topoisomerase (ATP-hydrolyzing) n=1 Tax=Kineosporia corallincola TaxID=2835133 RepID=A0ABS5TS83_9ACTN|nr:hypothetical protein [Kineosporia corallincola]MBT0773667.1 hypothetical protein [Kineosporia corallincola]
MTTPQASWRNTTHDWAATVDATHLAAVREHPAVFAPTGAVHLVLEVLAYAADEAAALARTGHAVVTLHGDGSVSVRDDGRGTDTRHDDEGRAVRKPVMSTRDLRFFDDPRAELLPDGHPRRGMSVVCALSTWLVHTNHRHDASWTQRYEHGVPVTGLLPLEQGEPTGTGTSVHFLPDASLGEPTTALAAELAPMTATWSQITVRIVATPRG